MFIQQERYRPPRIEKKKRGKTRLKKNEDKEQNFCFTFPGHDCDLLQVPGPAFSPIIHQRKWT